MRVSVWTIFTHLIGEAFGVIIGLPLAGKFVGLIALAGVGYGTVRALLVPYNWMAERARKGRLADALLRFEWFDRNYGKALAFLLPVLPWAVILYATVTTVAGLLKL